MVSKRLCILVVTFAIVHCCNSYILDEEDDDAGILELESGDPVYAEPSVEKVGAYVTQIARKPFTASLMLNNSYICSAVVVNSFWLLTVANCFETVAIKSYVVEGKTDNITARVGSNYNHKGGIVYPVKSLLNNFDYRVTAVKLKKALEFGPKVQAINLPARDADPDLGRMTTMMAWTPTGHLRAVNAPVIEATICDPYTNLLAGQYICLGGVQDPNKQFCRKDNGGAVVQNKTLIAITSFSHTCAVYVKIHAFPKISKIMKWLDNIIWDETAKPIRESDVERSLTTAKTVQKSSHENSNQRNSEPDEVSKIRLNKEQRPYHLTYNNAGKTLLPDPAVNNILPARPGMSLYDNYLLNKRIFISTVTGVDLVSGLVLLIAPFSALYAKTKKRRKKRHEPESAGLMVPTPMTLRPYRRATSSPKTKKQSMSDFIYNNKMKKFVEYDFEERRGFKASTTTPNPPQDSQKTAWGMLRNDDKNANNHVRGTNKNDIKKNKDYLKAFTTLNPGNARQFVEYD